MALPLIKGQGKTHIWTEGKMQTADLLIES